MQRWLIGLALLAGLALVATSLAIKAQLGGTPAEARRIPLPTGVELHRRPPPGRLLDAGGRPTSLARLRGRWVALAPVSTRCRESCPVTTGKLLRLRALMRSLGAGEHFAIAEVSVDPWHDSPAALRAQRRRSGVRLPIFTGRLEDLRRFWRFFGVGFHPTANDVAHTDALFLLDPSGQERVAIVGNPRGWRLRQMGADLRLLMGIRTPLPGGNASSDNRAAAARLLDGDRLEARLQSLRGRPVVLNAWASWCPPCREEMPLFASASARFGGAAFLGADVEDDAPDARKLLGEIPLGYPSYSTSLSALGDLAPATGTPFTVLLDRAGEVVGRHIGAYRSQEELDADVSSLIRS